MSKRPQRPKFLWDNAYLEKLAIEMGDECIFLCLSPVSFRMLTDMTKMLLWATRYEDGEVAELGRVAYRELNVPCLEDLHALLDSIQLQNNDWLQSQFDDLGSRMTELEEMDINVTQTVGGCGCGCSGEATATTQTVDGGLIINPEDTGIIPPYMTDEIVMVNSARCRSANYLAVKMIAMIRGMENLGDTGATIALIVLGIVSIVTILSPILGDEVIAVTAFVWFAIKMINLRRASGYISNYFADIADRLQANINELTCALYSWETAGDIGSIVESWVNNEVDNMAFDNNVPAETVTLYKDFINSVMGSYMFNWFVDNINTVIPSDFVPQHDCNCGATGDSCPTQNIVLAGFGTLPSGDLTGTTQGLGSSFNSETGYYEVIFELTDNYCVTIDNGQYVGELTPTAEHETCAGGVMVASDGSCIRRFVERSQTPFATAVTFTEQTVNCDCEIGCDTSFFGAYSDYYASIMCYERIDVPVFVANRGEFGQQYEIIGRDIRLFGTNHPGLETVGIDVDLGVRPHNAVALAFTVELAGDLVKGAMVTPSDAGQSLLISSGGDTSDGVKSLFYDTVVSYNSTFKNAWGVEANKLRLFGVGGMQIGLISDIASASLGKSYDITFTDIAWLIDTRF